MKRNISVEKPTPKEWGECVLENFNQFLSSHADCERKVSAMAMSFVAKYPNRRHLVLPMVETAIEELEHFRAVFQMMKERNIPLNHSIQPDDYVNALLENCRTGREERFLDRMLTASIIETRACERFKMLSNIVKDEKLKIFYRTLYTSEAKHGNIYIELMFHYFSEEEIYSRLSILNTLESEVMSKIPVRPSLL